MAGGGGGGGDRWGRWGRADMAVDAEASGCETLSSGHS